MSALWYKLQLLMVDLKAKFMLKRKRVFQSIADWDTVSTYVMATERWPIVSVTVTKQNRYCDMLVGSFHSLRKLGVAAALISI